MSIIPPNVESARYSNGSNFSSDDEGGIFMTIDTKEGTEFFAIEPPKALLKKNSSQNEKQISVDPISLQGSNTTRKASFRLISPPKGLDPNAPPLPTPPPKLKFVSSSLSSSPMSVSKKIYKKCEHDIAGNNLARVQSMMDDAHLVMVEANTRKSKSLGDGEISGHTDDFDLWLEKSSQNSKSHQNNSSNNNNSNSNGNSNNNNNSFSNNKFGGVSKPPLGPNSTMKKSESRDPNYPEEGFKCGKLCLILPRGKVKPVRSTSSTSTMTQTSNKSEITTEPLAISRRVSLEKFECGSWASSLDNEEAECANLFFDLPMELIRCSVSDMQSPVTAAFVFDNDVEYVNNKKENDMDIEMDFHAFLEAQS